MPNLRDLMCMVIIATATARWAYAAPVEQPVSLASPSAFFAMLNLDDPKLKAVKAAVDAKDWPAAKAAYARFFRSREITTPLIEHFKRTTGTPNTKGADQAVNLLITEYGSYQFKGEIQWRHPPMVTVCRFPHFPNLAKAYVDTGDEKYARAIVRDMRSYTRAWPIEDARSILAPFIKDGKTIGEGNPWSWGQVGYRGMRWLACLNVLRHSPNLSDDDLILAVRCIVEDMLWTAPQIKSWRAIHNGWFHMLTYELAISQALPEFKAAASWGADARAGLDYYLTSAFYPDGACKELTMAYSVAVVDQVNEVLTALEDGPDNARLRAIGKQATRFHIALVRPDTLCLPAYGDLNPASYRDSLLRAAESYGIDWAEYVYSNGTKGTPPPFTSFPPAGEDQWGGLYALRDGWSKNSSVLFIDGGPWGTSHQHCDRLSIEVVADGTDFIVDPGSNIYHDTDPKSFRVNMSYGFQHNTLTINGVDEGPLPKEAKQPLDNRWEPGKNVDVFESQYDFHDVKVPVVQRRRVVFVKGAGWLMEDVLTGESTKPLTVEQTFQCPPSITPVLDGANVNLVSNKGPVLHVTAIGSDWTPRVVKGEKKFPGSSLTGDPHSWTGWVNAGRGWCGRYRTPECATPNSTSPAPAVVFTGHVKLPFVRRLWLVPTRTATESPAKLEVHPATGTDAVTLTWSGGGGRPPVTIISSTNRLDVK